MSGGGMVCPEQQDGIRRQGVSKSIFSDRAGVTLSLGAYAAINRETPSKTPYSWSSTHPNDGLQEAGNTLVASRKGKLWYV